MMLQEPIHVQLIYRLRNASRQCIARRTLQPKIPLTATEFCNMLLASTLKDHFKYRVALGSQTAAIFFSDEMKTFLNEATNIQFDGTFQTVPVQFLQLWTIFISVGRHTMPAIHCLMMSKSQELYIAILKDLAVHVPQFQPIASMSGAVFTKHT